MKSTYNDHPPLVEWLNKHNARFCYVLDPPRSEVAITPRIEAWRVGAAIVLVVLYPLKDGKPTGWSLFTEPNTTLIKETFADVELRIGLTT